MWSCSISWDNHIPIAFSECSRNVFHLNMLPHLFPKDTHWDEKTHYWQQIFSKVLNLAWNVGRRVSYIKSMICMAAYSHKVTLSLSLSCSILFVMLRRGWISLSLLGYHQHFTLEKLMTLSAFGRKLQISEETQRSIYHLGNLNSWRMFCHKFNWQAYTGNEACYFQNYNHPIFLRVI